MNEETKEQIVFLQQQLEWSREQAQLLEAIERKLIEMRELAEASLDSGLSQLEWESLNEQFQQLRNEVIELQRKAAPETLH
ncbi:hypothetical protein [Alkalihalophilus marmarensis]|uniref:Uncharacterized protein n=1 Tax=Alkalihalophilus marmarensis DSM 21297 TaxID=1188261 RepID=U6SK81_9BACI|nr:hypothetical protein [Alkalihalophilus marmarensis]ERN52139.1 hypothetical protein A33I_17875 [Alkalihalophilus marmarensis DSM 21297]